MSRWLFRWLFSRAWPEADDELTDRETVVLELMDGQYSIPVRVSLPSIRPRAGWRDVSPGGEELEISRHSSRLSTTNIGRARPVQLPYRYEARTASQSFLDRRVADSYPDRFFRAHDHLRPMPASR
jgi:hypothetical protein